MVSSHGRTHNRYGYVQARGQDARRAHLAECCMIIMTTSSRTGMTPNFCCFET